MVGAETGTVSVRCRLEGGCSRSSGWCLCSATREPWEATVVAPAEEPFVSGPRAGSPGLGVVDVSVNANPRNVALLEISCLLID